MWAQIFKYATEVSSVASLGAFLAALFVWVQSRRTEQSVVDTIKGEGIVDAETVVRILKLFRSDEARLAALQQILGYSLDRAKDVLDKVKPNVDVGKFSLSSQVQARRSLLMIGSVLLLFFVVFAALSLATETTGPIAGLIVQEARLAAQDSRSEERAKQYGELFAGDAVIEDVRNHLSWVGRAEIQDRFRRLPRFRVLNHRLVEDPRVSGDSASARTISTVVLIAPGPNENAVNSGNEAWVFEKVDGKWRIKTLSFNMAPGEH